MSRMRTAAIVCVLTFLFFAVQALAEAPQYQSSSETTLSGEVLYVADHGSQADVCVIMKDGHNEIQVFLAPRPFLSQEGVELQMRDTIRVVGSRTIWNGTEVILARVVTAGSKTVTLRNDAGEPRW